MVMQAILVGLVAAFGCFDYQLGTLYAFRPIVLCPLVGIALGDLQTGLAVGASLELLFMGSISIGAYVPPSETVGGVLACAFAISLGQGTEAAIALAMPIAILSQAIGNLLQPIWPLIVDWGEKKAGEGDLRSTRIAHWGIGLWGCLEYFLLCGGAFLLGADAVQGILEFSRLEDTYILEEDGQDRIDNLHEMVAEARQFEQDFPDAPSSGKRQTHSTWKEQHQFS